jgi:hypothetical protein
MPEFVEHGLSHFMADLGVAGTYRLDILLIKHDAFGPCDRSNTLF